MQAAALVALPLIVAELALQPLVRSRLQQLDRELMRSISDHRTDALLPLYRRQYLLRFAAPKHELLGRLGLIYERLGEPESAAVALRDALETAPRTAQVGLANRLGEVLLGLGRQGEAERCFRLVASVDEDNVQARYRLGELLAGREATLDEAIPLLQFAAQRSRRDGEGARIHGLLADGLARLGRTAAAARALERAREDMGDDPEIAQLVERVEARLERQRERD